VVEDFEVQEPTLPEDMLSPTARAMQALTSAASDQRLGRTLGRRLVAAGLQCRQVSDTVSSASTCEGPLSISELLGGGQVERSEAGSIPPTRRSWCSSNVSLVVDERHVYWIEAGVLRRREKR
jgi:hypothetical protein